LQSIDKLEEEVRRLQEDNVRLRNEQKHWIAMMEKLIRSRRRKGGGGVDEDEGATATGAAGPDITMSDFAAESDSSSISNPIVNQKKGSEVLAQLTKESGKKRSYDSDRRV
jgi:hypothetical protein